MINEEIFIHGCAGNYLSNLICLVIIHWCFRYWFVRSACRRYGTDGNLFDFPSAPFAGYFMYLSGYERGWTDYAAALYE